MSTPMDPRPRIPIIPDYKLASHEILKANLTKKITELEVMDFLYLCDLRNPDLGINDRNQIRTARKQGRQALSSLYIHYDGIPDPIEDETGELATETTATVEPDPDEELLA